MNSEADSKPIHTSEEILKEYQNDCNKASVQNIYQNPSCMLRKWGHSLHGKERA